MATVRRMMLIILFIFVLTACATPSQPQPGGATTVPQTTTDQPAMPGYPGPASTSRAYPVATVEGRDPGYPVPGTTTSQVESLAPLVAFIINRPLVQGQTTVSGTGPANVPFMLLDITTAGELVGMGTIDKDGNFSIKVQPLPANHRIGITLGSLEGTKYTVEMFQRPEYNGEFPFNVPLVGFFFDTVKVDPK